MIECNNPEASFDFTTVLKTTVTELKLAIEGKTGGSVAENCYAFIDAVNSISAGSDCTDCENNLQSCMDAKALLETEVNDLNSQITTLTNDLNTCTTDKTEIQSNLDDCIADKAVIQDALDTANVTIGVLQYRLDTVNTQLNNVLGRVIAGTEVEKMTALAIDKNGIKDAIEDKIGSELTEDLSTYSASIDAIPLDSYTIASWEEQAGRSKMVALVNLYPSNNNTFRYRIYNKDGGSLNVNWGDGVVEDLQNGYIEHTYDYDALNSKVFTNYKKQALVTITTTDETDCFKDMDALQKTSLNILSITMEHCKIECDYDGLLISYVCAYQSDLKTFEFIGECNATSMKNGFFTFGKIDSVKFKNMNNVVNLDHLFYYTKVSDFTVTNGTVRPSTTVQMFYLSNIYNNYKENVVWDMSESDSAYYMYGYNHSVKFIDLANTGHLTNWNYFALDCYATKIININMTSAISATRAFEDLWELETINLTLLPISTDITNCYTLSASEIENLILNQLKDVSSNDTNEVLKLTGTVTEDELSQESLDHAVAYGWDLVF